MTVDAARAKSIFLAASELPDPAQRADYLVQQCGGDGPLRARVEALLRAHDAATDLGDQPSGAAFEATVDAPAAVRPGTLIAGRYKLIEVIGEGGMGTVWLAEQKEPVKRKVAVKLIKPGMDSKSVLARFEAERQALAMMDHPNIARVFDGGMTAEGRPFFVMEFVKGVPLTEYCDNAKLSLKERLQLFTPVCQAVQHAHQKGIIHRDLKPSNILICLYDGKAVPKVIDFGLAKAMHQSLTEQSLHTAFGMMVGTPLYMSPEQAEHNNLDVDTRTDIYSLGVILYELLTGSTPLERQQLKQAALNEILRLIKEFEPPKPSTRLSGSASLPSVAAQRSIEPKQLSKLLAGDLDWIVMKALDKERSRRYETANGLTRDIERYLNDEAVEACPPTTAYRLKKFIHRNRLQVIAASLVLLALIAGIVGTSVGLYQANVAWGAEAGQRAKAEAAAEQERLAKEDAVAAAEKERLATELTAARLKQIETINNSVFDIFAEFDIEKVKEGTEPVEYVLSQKLIAAGKTLDEKAIQDPLVLANMRDRLGQTLLSLGERPAAIELLRAAVETRTAKLGPDHTDTLHSMSNLAGGYLKNGQLEKALPMFEETFKLMKAKNGPDHPDTLDSMGALAMGYHTSGQRDKALPMFEDAAKRSKDKLGLDHPSTLNAMNSLAGAYLEGGQFDKALPLLEESLPNCKAEFGPDHPDTLLSMHNLAACYQVAGKLNKALPLFEETLKLTRAKLGSDHPDTLLCMNNLAEGYRAAAQLDKALPLLEETFELTRAKIGLDHPHTLASMNNLAVGYKAVGQLDKALPLYEETLNLMKTRLGTDHPETLSIMNNLAMGYRAAGQLDKALPLLEESLKLRKTKVGTDHPDTLLSMNNLANGYRDAGQLDKALPLLEETLMLSKDILGADHPNTLVSMSNLAACYWNLNQLDKSVPLFEEILPLQEKKLSRAHPNTQMTVGNLGVNYRDAGRVAEAIPLLEEAYKASKKIPNLRFVGPQLLDAYVKAGKPAEAAKLIDEILADARTTSPKDSPQLGGMMAKFGMSLLELKGFAEAEPLLREALIIREKTQPDDWTTFNSQSLLGGALLGQKKYADAEPLLLKGYAGMKAREALIPEQGKVRLPEALERLVLLYTDWHAAELDQGYDAKAAEWQTKLKELNAALATEKSATTPDK
jgi:serine/threonine protein kinase/Tfp pilus assembly protein PilF